jgi:hypothetical protein
MELNNNNILYIIIIYMAINETDILDYIIPDNLKKLDGYQLINNINKIKKGGVIRYINKADRKFNNGGIVVEIKKKYRLIKIINYKKTKCWHVYYDENLIYYNKKLSYRELMINMATGIQNKAVKITKL